MPKERQTCTECSMRRQKCDRNLPCSRCVKRGDADKCTREWPKDGYDPKVHRIYPRPDRAPNESPTSVSHSSPQSNSASGGELSEAALHPSLRTPASSTTDVRPFDFVARRSSDRQSVSHPTPSLSTTEPHDAPTNPLEFLSLGKPESSNYHVRSAELVKDPRALEMDWDWDYSNGFGGTGAQQISFLQLLVPSKKQVYDLVDYHLSSALWYHAAFHGPTFRKELNEAYNASDGYQVRDTDLRWSALLFAVMAGTMSCASDSLAQSWGFQKVERGKLTRQWFKAALSCLNLADYMWRHHMYSVQAIEVLTMSAHILGFSNTQSTLLGAALKIAQGLGLQRLSAEEDTPIHPGLSPAEKEKVIRRELGRRMWIQLCIQDWFSIPFSEMYTIQRHHFQTIGPEPMDDDTLMPVSVEQPTVISFVREMTNLARLFSECHDAIMKSSTLLTKYDEVIKYEQKIRDLYHELPDVMSIHKPFNPSWPHWIVWARRSLAVCYAHKQIMVHRHFLGRSFTEPTFQRTRETCMSAAKTILTEAKKSYNEDEGPVLWIDQAFMVAAGITLSLDLFHLSQADPQFKDHRKYVEISITLLGKLENSMIAMRGIRLLSSLLAEQARLAANQSMDNFNRTKRSREPESVGPPSDIPVYADVNHNKRPKTKFDVPRFVESLGDDSFAQSLRNNNRPRESGMHSIFDNPMQHVQSHHNNPHIVPPYQHYGSSARPSVAPTSAAHNHGGTYTFVSNGNGGGSMQRTSDHLYQYQNMDLGFETFEQLFPPQTGISNSFLFEDLLNFDL